MELTDGVLATHHQLRGMECGRKLQYTELRVICELSSGIPTGPIGTLARRYLRCSLLVGRNELAIPRDSPYTNEIAQFARYVSGEAPMWSGLADSYRDLEVPQDILTSAAYIVHRLEGEDRHEVRAFEGALYSWWDRPGSLL